MTPRGTGSNVGMTVLSGLVYLLILALISAAALGIYRHHRHQLESASKLERLHAILYALDEQTNVIADFNDAFKLARSTPRISLSGPMQRMQNIEKRLTGLPGEGCASAAGIPARLMMDMTIAGMRAFMREETEIMGTRFDAAAEHGDEYAKARDNCRNQTQTAIQALKE